MGNLNYVDLFLASRLLDTQTGRHIGPMKFVTLGPFAELELELDD